MRAARFHRHGGPDVVCIEQVPRPEPRPGEVVIDVRAAAMNHLDLWVRRGLPIETTMPHIGGSDVAGTVAELGAGVEGWQVGERVVVNPILFCGTCEFCVRGQESLCRRFRILGEHTDGGFAEAVAVPASALHRLPDDYPFDRAAALPVSYQTAWRALVHQAAVRPGEEVLLLGASGGTAIAALQVARLIGARIFAVTSGEENVERVRALGADVVYDRERVDFSKEIRRDTDRRGVDVVVENVGEATWGASLRSLAPGGRLVTYGATSGPHGDTDLRLVFWRQLRIIGSTMASRAEFSEMLRVALRGRIEPVVDRVMPLEEARAAHERLEAGEQFGKIVLIP
jgi:NADPH:quinone reductase-like Zn-dependent oxidoreductase